MSPGRLHFSALHHGRCFLFRMAASILVDVFPVLASVGSKWSHTSPVFERSSRIMAGFFCCLVHAIEMPVRAFLSVLHPCARSQRTGHRVRFAFWPRLDDWCFWTMFSTPSVCLTLGEQAQYCLMKHLVPRGLRGQRRVLRGAFAGQHHSTRSIREGFVSKLKVAMRKHRNEEEWDFMSKISHPCLRTLLHSYQVPRNRVPGAEADRCQSNGTSIGEQYRRCCQRHAVGCKGGCFPDCRTSVTAEIAPYSSNILSLGRGYHLSLHVVVAHQKVPTV